MFKGLEGPRYIAQKLSRRVEGPRVEGRRGRKKNTKSENEKEKTKTIRGNKFF